MVVVRCLILCSKFIKNHIFVGRALPGPAEGGGDLQRSPRSPNWIMREGMKNGDGRAGGGGKRKRQKMEGWEGRVEKRGIPQMKSTTLMKAGPQ